MAFYLGLIGAAGIIALLLYSHPVHFIAYLPFLFLLACPFLHMFMHGGHGRDRHQPGERSDSATSTGSRTP